MRFITVFSPKIPLLKENEKEQLDQENFKEGT